MLEFLIDPWNFMRVRKKFWLAPIIIVLLLFGILIDPFFPAQFSNAVFTA